MVPFMKRNSKPASEVANEGLAPSAWVLIPVLWSGQQPPAVCPPVGTWAALGY